MGAKIICGHITGWEIQKNYDFPQITKQIGLHWIYRCPDPAVWAIRKLQHEGVYWSREVCEDNKLCIKVTTKADSKELKEVLTNAEQPDSKTSHKMYAYQIQTQELERKNRELLALISYSWKGFGNYLYRQHHALWQEKANWTLKLFPFEKNREQTRKTSWCCCTNLESQIHALLVIDLQDQCSSTR